MNGYKSNTVDACQISFPTNFHGLCTNLFATRFAIMYKPTSGMAWAFMFISSLQSVFAITIDSILLHGFNKRLLSLELDDESKMEYITQQTMRLAPTYIIILILGCLYHPALCWDTLRLQNFTQMIGACLFSLAIFGYSLLQILQIRHAIAEIQAFEPRFRKMSAADNQLTLALPGVIAITTTTLSLVAWRLTNIFAWTTYKQFSADMVVRRRYMLLQVDL